MLKSLPIKLKLVLLAGVPVIGAIVLSYLVAADAQRRLDSAKALGSIEDLARLATLMSDTVDSVQEERMKSALLLGRGQKPESEVARERANTEESVRTLRAFLEARDVSKLPPRLAAGLRSAQERFTTFEEARASLGDSPESLEVLSTLPERVNADLINATAALTGLSDDGVMLRNIQALVTVLELQERASREGALLSYVFAKQEYPPGGYKSLVNLVTEQEVFDKVFRQSTSQDLVDLFDDKMHGKEIDRATELRRVALDTMDDNFGVDADEWFRVQSEKITIYRALSAKLNDRVKEAALAKIAEAEAAVSMAKRVSLGVVATSLLLAIVIAMGISRSVGSLAAAAHEVQTKGDFHVRARKMSGDELGRLTDAFNGMLEGIQKRDEELEHHRQNLEGLVATRTAELDKRNQAMRVVLDNVEQGLSIIRPDGTLESERSLAFDEMFQSTATRFSEVLAANDNNLRDMLDLGWEGLTDGFLPPEIAVDQIPRKIVRNGRHFELSYKPMGEESFDGALLMVTDVTAQVQQRRKEAEQRELVSVFEAVMRDKTGFIEFFNDVERMVTDVATDALPDIVTVRRVLHTIKGNTAIFGVTSVAEVCHHIESASIEEERALNEGEREHLLQSWKNFADRVRVFSTNEEDVLEIQYAELEKILDAVRGHLPYDELEHMLETLRYEPTSVRFHRIGDQAKRLAQKLGKGELRVEIDSHDVRLPSDRWGELWSSLVHVVRNALDHGLEEPAARAAVGKPEGGTLALRSKREGENYVIEIADDGRGIDWKRVGEKARALGLPGATRDQLVDALFHDGLSTRDKADETSGRGVGMSAVKEACEHLGGRIQVVSSPGKGTTFRLLVPIRGNDAPSPLSVRPGARPSIRPVAPPSERKPPRATQKNA